jgi:tetratricopeptide (TPR) repeat protein
MESRRNRLANAEKVRELLDSAFASRYHDIETTLRLSSAAVALAEEKRHELPPDLVVAAWTQYGNALRIAGRSDDAENALDKAAATVVSDPSTRAHILEVKASLHRDTDRFESAAQFLTAAIDEHRSIGDSLGEARALNLLGIVYMHSKDQSRSLRAFQAALDLLGPDAPVDAFVMTGHNLLEALIHDGRLSAAAAALALLEPFYRRITSKRLAAKAEWARARLCRESSHLHAAQLAYERAYELLSTEPRSPELASLVKEMAELEAVMSSPPVSAEPEMEREQGPEPGGEGDPTR